ncbi:MAG: hypothetical protein UY71_C0027G0008 [Parcubacteria group bacterium GW2011_GWB1_52_7]|nr:MAG: hypothetical protein UY71_C0027G0008 [Parcubacteria group bacterium GW2011_GWB1_52_7]KKW31504.1 MAG: hypothetical protein UY75_C0006G0013 [Parcubacteria group bacterium GW2011_GWC2_52_8c]
MYSAIGYLTLGAAALAYLACGVWIVKTQIAAAMSGMRDDPLSIPDLVILLLLGPVIYGLGLIFLALGTSIDAVGAKLLSLIRRGGRFFIS